MSSECKKGPSKRPKRCNAVPCIFYTVFLRVLSRFLGGGGQSDMFPPPPAPWLGAAAPHVPRPLPPPLPTRRLYLCNYSDRAEILHAARYHTAASEVPLVKEVFKSFFRISEFDRPIGLKSGR